MMNNVSLWITDSNRQQSPAANKMWRGCLLGILVFFCTIAMGSNAANCEQVLILYDSAGPFEHVGPIHTRLFENLLGHFKVDVVHKPVTAYKPGDVDTALATFYLGAIFNEPTNYAPESEQLANYNHFLKDVSQTSATIVWVNYNLWWLADYLQKNGKNITDVFGFSVKGVVNEGYNRITYKGTELYKGVVPHANPGANLLGCTQEGAGRWACAPELNAIEIKDPAKVEVFAETYSSLHPDVAKSPYIFRSGNLWVVGDMPTVHFSEEDRYLALADLLHDMLGIKHEERHHALIRLEDVSAGTIEEELVAITQYLNGAHIPFAVSAIPVHVDVTGTRYSISQSPAGRHLSSLINNSNTGNAQDYRPNVSIVAHGYTHQSEFPQNPYDGQSGSDFEFYRVTMNPDNSLNYLGPMPMDVDDWALKRMSLADKELLAGGLRPFAWSAPHYLASAKAYSDIMAIFPTHYGRLAYFIQRKDELISLGQFFPFEIHRDAYGYQIIPESIGYFEPLPIAGFRPLFPSDMVRHAKKQLVVRDGYASFFYHPTKGVPTLKEVVENIQALGYEFVAPKSVFPSTLTADGNIEIPPSNEVATDPGSSCFLSLLK